MNLRKQWFRAIASYKATRSQKALARVRAISLKLLQNENRARRKAAP